MKRFLLLFCIVFACIAANGQIKIKQFDNIGLQAITKLLSNPPEEWTETGMDGFKKVSICINPDKSLRWFATKSPTYCIIPEVVPGGIKVGDSLSKLKSIDFINSNYGQGKPGNGLTRENEGNKTFFYIYHEEYNSANTWSCSSCERI